MIKIFYSGNFYLNKIYSKDKQICLASTDSDILNTYGIIYSEDISLVKNSKTSSYYINENNDTENIVLQLYYVDENDKLLVWDDEKLQDTYKWLVSEDFLPFISEDNMNLTYYIKAIKIVKKFNYQFKGYLEVTFKPFSSYAYREYIKPVVVNGTRNLYMYNYSNVEHDYRPIFEIENLGDESSIISIKNTKINTNAFEISGIQKNQKVFIDMLTGVVQDIETGENLMSNCNRKWFKMSESGCDVELKGNFKMVLKAQFPILV